MSMSETPPPLLLLLIFLVCIVFVIGIALAQPPQPVLVAGYVFDTHGNPLEGAIVQLLNINTSELLNTTTAADGSYTFTLVSVSEGNILKITATYKGYSDSLYHTIANISMPVQHVPDIILLKGFDTGAPENPYPSIYGVHRGTITPSHDIYASKLYTFACTGTGGHTEYVKIWNETWSGVEARWRGYHGGDWHYVEFPEPFVLKANNTYNYEIRTGSYPQIHHATALETPDGTVTCEEFIDANGIRHEGWIPAIRLLD
ncbi:MAG: hypothetical protein DRN91_04935 [Candidatus Alkanophagales archaeon]|nr:MAG: hypothetical protein DRN91_04935 [Candidatus Alkanophagales archaeon]